MAAAPIKVVQEKLGEENKPEFRVLLKEKNKL